MPASPQKPILKRLLLGFIAGASIPAALGAYGMYQFKVYAASFPPGEFVCGNAALGPMALIIFVAPLLGLIGGLVTVAVD